MAAGGADVEAALRTVLDPHASSDQAKHKAQRDLEAFKSSETGLHWAINVLDSAVSTSATEPALWLAADTALFWARYRAAAGSQALLTLRQRLWAWLQCGAGRGPALPHFVLSKLAAALACLACLTWPAAYPEFWPELQHCLAEQPDMGLRLLAALLEEFQSLAQATSSGYRGRVLSSQIPGIQARYAELQPAAVSLLCSLLRHAQPGLAATAQHGQAAELVTVLEALRTLWKALSDPPARPEQQHEHISLPALLDLLFSFAQVLELAVPETAAHGPCQEVAAAAMDCIGDLLTKPWLQQEAREALDVLLARLPACLESLQRRWERGQLAAQSSPEEDPALPACARLLSQFAATQLGRAEASPAALQGTLSLLGQVSGMMFARRRPVDVVAFGEVWHAVLDRRDLLEAEEWDDVGGEQAQQPKADPYKAAILQVAQLVLATLFSPATPTAAPEVQPPFSANLLDSSEGSGAAMEDWLQAVAVGGEGNDEEGEAAAAAAGMEEDEELDEVLVPGSRQHSAAHFQSEQEVYTRLAESFLGRAAATYSAQMIPLLLRSFGQSSAAFAHAAKQLAALAQQAQHGAAGASQQQQLEGTGAAAIAASRDLEVSLRLMARCGPGLPLKGLGEQACLTDLVQQQAGSSEPLAVTGAHAAATYSMLLDLAAGWQQTVQVVAAGGAGAGAAFLPALAPVGARIYRTLGALTATWLSRLILAQLTHGSGGGDDVATLASRLAHSALGAPAQLLGALGPGACQLAAWEGALRAPAMAAAEALVPLTSIALSSSMKPAPELLQGLLASHAYQAVQQLAAQALPAGHLPTRALRALWISLSDLSLRSWSGIPAASFPAEACAAHFAGAAAPLVHCFAEVAHSVGSTQQGAADGAELAARRAAAVANSIILSYAGTPKHVRGILYNALVAPILAPTLALLRQCAQPRHQHPAGGHALGGRAGAPLLRLLGSVIEVQALELGAQGLEQLLNSLVEVYSVGGGDASMESDLALMRLLCNVMGQGGNKHAALLLPSLQYCVGVWHRAGAGAGSRNADVGHIKAVALASLLCLLRHRWRQLSGALVQPLGRSAGAGAAAFLAAPPSSNNNHHRVALHQQLQQSAAAAAAAAGPGGAGVMPAAGFGASLGPAAIAQVVALLEEYLSGAAGGQAVLAAADVRLVLEEVYELQLLAKLYQSPYFQPVRESVLASLLGMLLSRCYTAAQNDLVDTLFSVAAANWSDFHLSFLPRFVEHRLARLGGTERGALLGLFGVQDLDAPTFEKQALAFMNDVLFYEQALGLQ